MGNCISLSTEDWLCCLTSTKWSTVRFQRTASLWSKSSELLLKMLQGFSHCPSSSLCLPLSLKPSLFSSICFSLSFVTKDKISSFAFLAFLHHSLSLSFSLSHGVQGILGRHPICRRCVVIAFCWWLKKTQPPPKFILVHLFVAASLNVCTWYAFQSVGDVGHAHVHVISLSPIVFASITL